MSISRVKKYYPHKQLRQIEDAKFSYSSLVKAFEMIEKCGEN